MLAGLGPLRHIISIIICFFFTFVGVAVMSWGAARAHQSMIMFNSVEPLWLFAMMVAIGLLTVAVLAGVIASSGPLASGIVFGLLPWAWLSLFPRSFWSFVGELAPSGMRSGVYTMSQPVVFALIFVMLCGAGAVAAIATRLRPRLTG